MFAFSNTRERSRSHWLMSLAAALLVTACQDGAVQVTGVEPPADRQAAAAHAPTPLLRWSPADAGAFDFEPVIAGEKQTREFTLTNTGGSATGALTIGWAGASSFRITSDGCGRASLPPGRSCAVTVEFEPQVIGHEQGLLIAAGQRRDAHASLDLRGTGVQSRLQESSSYSTVVGLGTPGLPYMKICDWYDPATGDCIVYFPWRTLSGLTSAQVPSYACPYFPELKGFWDVSDATEENSDYQWLLNRRYVPFGTHVPHGVDVEGLGWIGISIPNVLHSDFFQTSQGGWVVGTVPDQSSVTNWNTGARSYRVVLHCAKQRERGYMRPWF